MQCTRTAVVHLVRATIACVVLAGCTLPRSGPTAGEIISGADSEGLGVQIVAVSPSIAAASRSVELPNFGAEFVGAGEVSADAISPGDTISVRVWENVDTGLLAGVGQRVTVLEQIQVDQSGQIFVPYAGRLQAAGRSPDALRREITAALEAQTPEPQVEVQRTAGDGSTVNVMGAVGLQGVYPIEAPTRRLSAMLARAGGVSIDPEVALVKVQRGSRSGRIWLQDLYDDPRYDVALRSGDRIIVEQDRRSFTALGASEAQARIAFTKRNMSVIEALGAAGGLDGRAADPTGIFVFRLESAQIANRVTGRNDLVGPQRMAYVLDLTTPEGLFSAREFVIRDEDTVYVTEAPFAAWTRLLGSATNTVNFAASADTLLN